MRDKVEKSVHILFFHLSTSGLLLIFLRSTSPQLGLMKGFHTLLFRQGGSFQC